jgi:peptide deformylase
MGVSPLSCWVFAKLTGYGRVARGVARDGTLSYITAMIRPILLHPDPRLKKVCADVPDLTDELRTLADDMLQTMYDAPGVGLAAPQVGILHRLIVLDCVKEEGETARPLIMFNPEIIASSDEKNVYEEGCLSIPDLFADVTRPKTVQVRWMDRDGNEQNEEMDGLWATCVQHEIDHLEGKLFIDHIKPLRRQMITRKMVKLKRELARG